MSTLRSKANTLRDQFYINTQTVVSSATTPSDTYTVTGGFQAISPVSGDDVLTIGAVLVRDMGKTVVSSSRTFRKVQLLVNALSTSGVGGPLTVNGVSANVDFLTAYIEVANGPGLNGVGGTPAPVALYPSLW